MTLQEIFDSTWKSFVIEKKAPGFNHERQECVYRGPNGEKCAMGLLIKDEEYEPWMEGQRISLVLSRTSKASNSRFDDLREVPHSCLDRLQDCHDDSARTAYRVGGRDSEGRTISFHEEIKIQLEQFAQINGLKVPQEQL